MKSLGTQCIAVLGVAVILAGACHGQEMTDPYKILNKYFEASGGLERLKAVRTQHFEGEFSIGGMKGPIRLWTAKPGRSRVEINLAVINVTEGDNGDISWMLDTNGKVQKMTKPDEATLKRKDVERRMDDYEYADPGSDAFTVTFEGIEMVEETDCYAIKIANSINTDHHTYYISVDGFNLEKSVAIQGEKSGDTFYGDHREADGMLVAFYNKVIPYQTGQVQEITWMSYESNIDVDPSLFDPPAEKGKDYEFIAGSASENIPFRFVGNHLYVPVITAGKERLWVLDTGAGMSVVDKAFADEIGLEAKGDLKGRGAAGTVDASFTVLPPYELKGIRFKEQTVAVIDMSELIRRLGIDIAGILGFDFLSRFVTKVDYANELVSFYDPETFDYTGDGSSIDVHLEESVFRTKAVLDGTHSGTWLFDLGAGVTHLDGSYALREGYTELDGVLRMGHGAANEMQIKGVKGDSIEFAGYTLDDPDISFSYGGTDTVFAADKLGILGNSLFRNFVVYVDYETEQVILEKGEKFNQPWPEDGSGLNIGWTVSRDGVEVLYVSPDTPAEQAGFQKGDIIKSIDGNVVEPLDGVIATRELLMAEPGTTFDFVVGRGGKEQNLTLKLEKLY
ncbi:MAG: aspartyl protease family protein [Candidatus Eisenbacteria bacterium]